MKGGSSCSLDKSGSLRRYNVASPRLNKAKELQHGDDKKSTCHMLNTIINGLDGGGETSSSRKRYARQILSIEDLPKVNIKGELQAPKSMIAFSEKDATGIHPHNDDPMVITVKCKVCEIKIVLVDQESSADILYWEAVERLFLDPEDLKPFKGLLVGFLGEHVHVNGYITLRIIFGEEYQAKEIKFRYLVIDALFCII